MICRVLRRRLGQFAQYLPLLLAIVLGVGGAAPRAGADQPEPVRTLPVLVVTDHAYRATPQWRGVIRRVVEGATGDLADLIGLQVVVSAEQNWESPDPSASLSEKLRALRESTIFPGGLVVAFLGASPESDEDDPDAYQGFAFVGRPYVVLAADSARRMTLTLRHEIGHVFALPHIPGRNVMNPRATERSPDFDLLSLDLLRATRHLDLDSPTPFVGCDLDVVRDVFLLWEQDGLGRPIQMLNLGVAHRREGRPDEAARILEAAVRLDPQSAPAWFHLGRARRTLADHEGAARAFRRNLELDPDGPRSATARALLNALPASGVR